jgi:antitoxin YefM
LSSSAAFHIFFPRKIYFDKTIISIIMTIKKTEIIIARSRQKMVLIQEYIPVTKAKSQLLNIIRKIENSDQTVAITKNGVPEAVMISMKKYEGLLETLEILSDKKAMKSLRKSIKEAQEGKWLDIDEVFEE